MASDEMPSIRVRYVKLAKNYHQQSTHGDPPKKINTVQVLRGIMVTVKYVLDFEAGFLANNTPASSGP